MKIFLEGYVAPHRAHLTTRHSARLWYVFAPVGIHIRASLEHAAWRHDTSSWKH